MNYKNNNDGNWISQYRGALCGVLAGGPIGLAILINIWVLSPALLIGGLVAFWIAGGAFGNTMQRLLEY